jgi:hypothetical protein
MKRKTIYAEKYYKYKRAVMRNEAESLVSEAHAIYLDEQGEIEVVDFDGQRRIFAVIRLERIIREEKAL